MKFKENCKKIDNFFHLQFKTKLIRKIRRITQKKFNVEKNPRFPWNLKSKNYDSKKFAHFYHSMWKPKFEFNFRTQCWISTLEPSRRTVLNTRSKFCSRHDYWTQKNLLKTKLIFCLDVGLHTCRLLMKCGPWSESISLTTKKANHKKNRKYVHYV